MTKKTSAEEIARSCAAELSEIAQELNKIVDLLAVLSITSQEAGEFSAGSTINTEFVAGAFSVLWDAVIDKQKKLEALSDKTLEELYTLITQDSGQLPGESH